MPVTCVPPGELADPFDLYSYLYQHQGCIAGGSQLRQGLQRQELPRPRLLRVVSGQNDFRSGSRIWTLKDEVRKGGKCDKLLCVLHHLGL